MQDSSSQPVHKSTLRLKELFLILPPELHIEHFLSDHLLPHFLKKRVKLKTVNIPLKASLSLQSTEGLIRYFNRFNPKLQYLLKSQNRRKYYLLKSHQSRSSKPSPTCTKRLLRMESRVEYLTRRSGIS